VELWGLDGEMAENYVEPTGRWPRAEGKRLIKASELTPQPPGVHIQILPDGWAILNPTEAEMKICDLYRQWVEDFGALMGEVERLKEENTILRRENTQLRMKLAE